jgi:hypothetical protein
VAVVVERRLIPDQTETVVLELLTEAAVAVAVQT